jgi:hypothetical protein
VDVEPWRPIPFEELREGRYASTDDADYAVVANYTCRGRVDLQSYYGEKVGWYLLPSNRLAAFDHFVFVEACTVTNQTAAARARRARAQAAATRRCRIRSRWSTSASCSRRASSTRANRIDDAKRMLSEGNRAFDVGSDDKPTEFETPGVPLEVARPNDVRSMRNLLVREIAAAEARLAAK